MRLNWNDVSIGADLGVLLISGTTASGKSSLALTLAQDFGAVIVSADAMTVYRGLDIGTAKPTIEERSMVRHYGIDEKQIDEDFDVSCFVDMVDRAVADHERVIIAGGTTFWLSALVRPLASLPAASTAVRASLNALEEPHFLLSQIDPDTASRLHPNDRVRVIRALEVYEITGKTQTELHAQEPKRQPIDAEIVFLDRENSQERIEQRIQSMLESGYVAEVQGILDAGWAPDLKPLKSFAYRHLVEHCNVGLSLDEAVRRTGRDTRHYAKKQRTWARNLGWKPVGQPEALLAAKRAFDQG